MKPIDFELTASSEQLACSMHRLFRDQMKFIVSGCVFSQQLIRRRTRTPLKIRASLTRPSIRDQYLGTETETQRKTGAPPSPVFNHSNQSPAFHLMIDRRVPTRFGSE